MNKDYIVLDYHQNKSYMEILENVLNDMYIEIRDMYGFVKLFEIESGMFTNDMYNDMMYSMPTIPDIRLGSVYLLNK